jgi:predicted DNA binding CopG/RHH family protein
MAILAKTPRTKVRVHTRLFGADVQEVKRRAREVGIPWQAHLRQLVHEMLRKEVKIG